jgi:hypothetical protein
LERHVCARTAARRDRLEHRVDPHCTRHVARAGPLRGGRRLRRRGRERFASRDRDRLRTTDGLLRVDRRGGEQEQRDECAAERLHDRSPKALPKRTHAAVIVQRRRNERLVRVANGSPVD